MIQDGSPLQPRGGKAPFVFSPLQPRGGKAPFGLAPATLVGESAVRVCVCFEKF